MTGYDDFSIRFGDLLGKGAFRTVASSESAGGDEGTFEVPFTADELAHLMHDLGVAVRAPRNLVPFDGEVEGAPDEEALKKAGGKLFRALIRGRVAERYHEHLGSTQEKGHGVCLRLKFSYRSPHLHRLVNLPWEALHDGRRFLGLASSSSVVRHVELPEALSSTDLRAPLGVLLVAGEYGTLDLAAEGRKIRDAWARLPGVAVDLLERPTFSELRRRLDERPFQVFHFMGHGVFDAHGHGALALSSSTRIPGEKLARHLDGRDRPRLVVLNACDTARVSDEAGHDPFTGVAAALVAHGLGAVVAMQFPISDAAALAFSERLYQRLADGGAIEDAVAAGRLAIDAAAGDGGCGALEWCTPVLYLRSARSAPHDSIVRNEPRVREEIAPPPEPSPLAGLPARRRFSFYALCLGVQTLAWAAAGALAYLSASAFAAPSGAYNPVEEPIFFIAAFAFLIALPWGFFRLGRRLRRHSKALGWTVGVAAAILGVSFWFLLLSTLAGLG